MKSNVDIYSKPIRVKKHRLATLFFMKSRKNPKKPGRELVVTFDNRFNLIDNFVVNYSYLVNFYTKNNAAGNHYHEKKQELFIPIIGSFVVILEDIRTKENESIAIDSKDYSILHVNTHIAHKVISKIDKSTLLVLATSANSDDDEYNYKI